MGHTGQSESRPRLRVSVKPLERTGRFEVEGLGSGFPGNLLEPHRGQHVGGIVFEKPTV